MSRRRFVMLDGSDETVAAPVQSLDVTWAFCGITQGQSQFAHGFVETAIEVDKCVRGPEPLTKFLPRDQFPGALQQQGQDVKWLLFQPDSHPVLAQFSGAEIHVKNAKAQGSVGLRDGFHRVGPRFPLKISREVST